MKSTFKTSAREMLIVQASPTRAAIWITAIAADGSRKIIPIPLHLAGVVAQAIEGAATMIEESCRPAPQYVDLPFSGPTRAVL